MVQLAHYLGITPKFVDGTAVGGTSFLMHVRHAAAALADGLLRLRPGHHGRERLHPRRQHRPAGWRGGGGAAAANSIGAAVRGALRRRSGPTTSFGMGILRYMKETGLTHEQLASVPVAQSKWVERQPARPAAGRVTVEDVMASRMICYPLHLLECCVVTDGGGAIVLTTADRAKDFPTKPVYILGTGESVETPLVSQMEDFTSSKAFRVASTKAFDEAQVTHSDIDHVMIYDAFAHLPIYALEDTGFLKPRRGRRLHRRGQHVARR